MIFSEPTAGLAGGKPGCQAVLPFSGSNCEVPPLVSPVAGALEVIELSGRVHQKDILELAYPDTIVYHLRKGICWHNKPPTNGQELTSDDVALSIKPLFTTPQCSTVVAYPYDKHIESIKDKPEQRQSRSYSRKSCLHADRRLWPEMWAFFGQLGKYVAPGAYVNV